MEQISSASLFMKSPERDLFNELRGDYSQPMFLLGLLSVVDEEDIRQAKLNSMSYTYERMVLDVAQKHDLVDAIANYEEFTPLLAADGGIEEETHE